VVLKLEASIYSSNYGSAKWAEEEMHLPLGLVTLFHDDGRRQNNVIISSPG